MRFVVLAALAGIGLAAVWAGPMRGAAIWRVAAAGLIASPDAADTPPTAAVAPDAPAADTLPFPSPSAERLVRAAEGQVGVTRSYDGSYAQLDFPGGDVPSETGVCTDVLIRAARAGLGIDLQLAVNRDMKADFAAYPANWGLTRPDPNIDHRRVPNLAVLLRRLGAELDRDGASDTYLPGDIVTWLLPGNLPHIGIVTDRPGADERTPMVIHNIGAGTRIEDRLFAFEITGHFRLTAPVLEKLTRLGMAVQ